MDIFPILIAAAAEQGSDTSLVGQFGIDWKLIIAQGVNFALVSYILWRFAFKPVLQTMEDRRKQIAEGLQFAEESKLQLAETEKRQAEVLREANTKAQEILHESHSKAKALEEKLKNETSKQIEEMRNRADQANELERQKMLSEVRQEIARLVVLTSGKVLQRELSADERTKLNATATEEIAQLN